MNLIDMHCDTIYELMRSGEKEHLCRNHLCIDLDGMKQAGTMVQFFACFINKEEMQGNVWDSAYQTAQEMIGRLRREERPDMQIALSYAEILEHKVENIISAVLTVEEGGVLNGEIARLEELYRQGIRLITLTWNHENCIGFPNSRNQEAMAKGLKPFGREVVTQMNELGMIVDVSHLSDGGFWDCIECSKAPIVASHSNARALCRHPRNLSDEMLKALAEKGGVAGLNFYPAFLKEEGTVSTADIARHAQHMIQVGGEDVVAVGTDFDGFEAEYSEDYISHVSEMEKVWESFKKEGITERQIDKIRSGNAERVMQEIL